MLHEFCSVIYIYGSPQVNTYKVGYVVRTSQFSVKD